MASDPAQEAMDEIAESRRRLEQANEQTRRYYEDKAQRELDALKQQYERERHEAKEYVPAVCVVDFPAGPFLYAESEGCWVEAPLRYIESIDITVPGGEPYIWDVFPDIAGTAQRNHAEIKVTLSSGQTKVLIASPWKVDMLWDAMVQAWKFAETPSIAMDEHGDEHDDL